MYKIDRTISDSATIQDSSPKKCLIFYKNKYCLDILKCNKNCEIVKDFPFIRAVMCNINGGLIKIANHSSVDYVTSIKSVHTLMDRARRVSRFDNIVLKDNDFSCAIIDTGIDPGIDLTVPHNRIIAFHDIISGKDQPYDDNGHGTFVASILAGSGVVSGGKYAGVDPKCNIVAVKALNGRGEGTVADILSAMQWILKNKDKYNIRVVCMSFGSTPQDQNDPLVMGAEVLWDNGIVVVSAVGNSGPNPSTIMSPAISRKIISVGAMDDGRIGDIGIPQFSSRGPAGNTYKPDVVASGVEITAACSYHKEHRHYAKMSGTSVATPIVAGVACRLISNNTTLTPARVKYIILNSTKKVNFDRNSEGEGYIYFG